MKFLLKPVVTMSEEPSGPKQNGTAMQHAPQLYSVARGPGHRYLAYSASRKDVQERFRDGVDQAHGVPPASQEVLTPFPVREISEQSRHYRSAPTLRVPKKPPSRWYASQAFTAPVGSLPGPAIALPPGFAQRPPTVAVCSLTERVGKTCLVATLGQVLSALGERVLLADTAASSNLPFYFGSRQGRPGLLRTFSSSPFFPSVAARTEKRAAIHAVNLQAEHFPRFESGQDLLLAELVQRSHGHDRILIDVATGGAEMNRLLLLEPTVLVPVLPDTTSVASLPLIEAMLRQHWTEAKGSQIFFLLNQFDESVSAHLELRETLRQQLGERLLPFAVHSSPLIGEAFSEGATVVDHAPDSAAAGDYRALAGWLRDITAPVQGLGFCGD